MLAEEEKINCVTAVSTSVCGGEREREIDHTLRSARRRTEGLLGVFQRVFSRLPSSTVAQLDRL